MSKEKKSKISYFQSNFTSTISVALVLLLLGIIAFLGILANTFSKELKENIGFSVVLQSETTPEQVAAMDKMWKASPYVSEVKYISKEAALQNWEAETGENLVELFGVNPLNAEYEVYVKAEYANLDSLQVIEKQLKSINFVDEIAMHKSEVDAANRNISNVALVLFVIAVLLMLISFVLINNTVRLTVYSRRFLIHTMKLVGAKPGFIRRPFVISNMLNGLIAAFVSMLFLLGVYLFLQNIDEALVVSFSALEIVAVFAGLIVLGVLICGLAAFLAADKYIRLSYDDLFKR
jgi:cell division transport system permease protein